MRLNLDLELFALVFDSSEPLCKAINIEPQSLTFERFSLVGKIFGLAFDLGEPQRDSFDCVP